MAGPLSCSGHLRDPVRPSSSANRTPSHGAGGRNLSEAAESGTAVAHVRRAQKVMIVRIWRLVVRTRILVTGAGGASATAFMKALVDEPVVLFAADMDPSVAGPYVWCRRNTGFNCCPEPIRSTSATSCRYAAGSAFGWSFPCRMQSFCRSRRRGASWAGTRALIPSDRTLEFAADRLAMLQACEGLVPVPRYAVFDHVLEPATWEYPVVLRSPIRRGLLCHPECRRARLPRP